MNRLVNLLVLLAALGVIACGGSALAQDSASDSFDPLRARFKVISDSLLSKRGLVEQDKPMVLALREQAREFAAAHPEDPRPWALIAQVSEWLEDQPATDEAYSRLSDLRPDDIGLALIAARKRLERSQYDEAITLLERFRDAMKTNLLAAQLLGQCYYATNRFDEALDLLSAVSPSSSADAARMEALIQPDIAKYEQYMAFWEIEKALRAAEAEQDDLPRVQLITSDGSIVLELFEDSVPNTVANFISLVESGFYDGLDFHRVIPDYLTEAGDPRSREGSTAASNDPGYYIADEGFGTAQERKHFAGSVSLANKDRADTGGSDFFITHKPTEFLNGRKVVFGRVIEGLDIAKGLTENEDTIISARVLRKRDHLYEPLKIAIPSATPPVASDTAGFEMTGDSAAGNDDADDTDSASGEPEADTEDESQPPEGDAIPHLSARG